MVLEKPLLPYLEWLLQFDANRWGALWQFLISLLVLAVVAILLGLLVGTILYGPYRAAEKTYRVIAHAGRELFGVSPRRIFALARLAVQEALRRRVIVALVVFMLLLLLAGWFLKPDREPAKLYFSFVLTATSFLGLFIALLLAVFSLPNDFKSKTIYTVVTKPVRAGDIILGRILGFTVVGTVMLAIMGGLSFVFVTRALNHTHTIAAQENLPERTSYDQGHSHALSINEAGEIVTEHTFDHEHLVTGSPGNLQVSAPQTTMRARVPKWGRLRFLNRQGVEEARGVSVGKEWGYRSFIEGGTQAAAIWTFDNVDQAVLMERGDEGEFLPLELVVRVFRTWKSDIDRPMRGVIFLQRPGSDLKTAPEFFWANDAEIDPIYFPRKLTDSNDQPIDLLDDLVDEQGRLEVVVQSLERAQYFGFAQADCYIRLRDGAPLWNFVKAYLSIWVQMVLVIAIAVMGSTVLSGPIAMLFTVAFILLGFYRDFFVSVATDDLPGGGPIEQTVRLFTGMNMISEVKGNPTAVWLMQGVDDLLQGAMQSLANVLPDFGDFNAANYVAYGFNIPANQIAQQLTMGAAYVVGLSIMGYFLLRNREVAK